jgi:hypothetical protein
MMEKHIIFLYPLHPVIQELKDILEKDGGYDINEVDDANEYRQLVGVIGNSITFTSDIKKIQSTIDAQAQLLKNGISKVVIMGKIQNFPSEAHQLRVLGVQELLPENTPLKALQFKLNLFLKSFEQVEAQKLTQQALEEKKAKKIISQKSAPLFVDNDKKNQLVQHRPSKPLFDTPADFKEYIKKSVTPLNVKPVEEKKKRSLLKPLFENKNLHQRVSAKKSGGIIFDEVPDEESNGEQEKAKGPKEGHRSGYKPFTVGDRNNEKENKKKELEEAADLIKKQKSGLRLTSDEEKKVHQALRLQNDGTQSIVRNPDEEDEEFGLKKKYQPLRLNSEKEKRTPYNPLRLTNIKDDNQSALTDSEAGNSDEDELLLPEEVEESTSERKFLRAVSSSKTKTTESEEELSLEYPDFYFPPSGITTFIPLLMELLHARPFNQNKFMQFLCFMFQKKLGGHLTYLLEKENDIELLASTHQFLNKEWDYKNHYSAARILEMKSFIIPTWSDDTFQSSLQEFYFPFYFNKERMGLAHAVFDPSNIKNAQEAMEVELLIVMARTVYLKEYRY